MRKVVAVELVSVDGVFEAPEEWAFSYSNDEMNEANASGWPRLTHYCWDGSHTRVLPPSGQINRAEIRWWTT